MDDQIPGLDGAGESADELELEPTAEEQTEQGGDPLDEISDPVARAQAKKHRAIARRAEKKEKVPDVVVPPATPPVSEFVTKADLQKANERKAIREATLDADIKANWSEIVPFFSSRRGKDSPEDILEDIKDAVILWKAHNSTEEVDTSVADLMTTPVVKTGGSGPTPKAEKKLPNPPNFSLPVKPDAWYPKTEV